MRFLIDYTETYGQQYVVEADTYEEGQEKLREAIQEGRVSFPEECRGSNFSNDTPEDAEFDDDDVDVR